MPDWLTAQGIDSQAYPVRISADSPAHIVYKDWRAGLDLGV